MKNSDFERFLKSYEKQTTEQRLNPRQPIIARIDGRTFHTYTKDMQKPFDRELLSSMVFTTDKLIKETDAKLGYTQSDEITLVFYYPNPESQPFFDGKVYKLTSVLASMATAFFNANIYKNDFAFFDCRVYNVPDIDVVRDILRWRYADAKKNAISMIGRAFFSHKELYGLKTTEIIELLKTRGVYVDSYPLGHRQGNFLIKKSVKYTDNVFSDYYRTIVDNIFDIEDFLNSKLEDLLINEIIEVAKC